jgi:signal transduction histidine kinase/CheY-like chemotaxis protein
MWLLARNISHSKVEDAATLRESLQSTIRNLMVVSAIFCLTCVVFLTSDWAGSRILWLLIGILAVGLIFAGANYLLKKHTLLSLILWMAGIVVIILAGCWLMQKPGLVVLSTILPLIAVVTISGWAGVALEGIVIALVWIASQGPFGGPLPPDQAVMIVGAGAFSGLLGWTASRELLKVAEWSMASFDIIRKHLEEAQDRQLELAQAQEDLTLANNELSRLTQRLKVLEKIAEEARQATTEFVANVSHELRTPLNMIIGYADLISKSPKIYGGSRLSPSLMSDIVAILRNAQHLATLVNDVLDLSQVEAGRMAVSRSWVSLEHTINEALAVVKGLFESKGLYLKSETSHDLPAVYFDETRIRQVIINLLSNAGRFTERGGVILRCRVEGTEVIVSVTDTGPGIAGKDRERIFEPFQQVDASIRRRFGGSGLGLTISKQFVEMHGGKMWLESELGVGTTFSFSLPIELPSPPLVASAGNSVLRSIIPDDEIGYRLPTRRAHVAQITTADRFVVVDPEQTLQRLIMRFVPDANVETAADVTTAIEALYRSPAQAMILNVPRSEDVRSMAINNLPFGTPAITCWLPGEHNAANRLGVVDYLIKPLPYEKLQATLASLGTGIKTVLIVDDEEDALHLLARHLEADEHGYRILQVTNGQRALSMLRSRRPDVMLLDLIMPGMDGFQVLEEKRRDATISDIPVIVISSRDPAGDPIVSNTFTVTHSGGLSQRDLITCIQALGRILAPDTLKEMAGTASAGT